MEETVDANAHSLESLFDKSYGVWTGMSPTI